MVGDMALSVSDEHFAFVAFFDGVFCDSFVGKWVVEFCYSYIGYVSHFAA